jgi:pyridoxal phosphate enzyme (YggS family)
MNSIPQNLARIHERIEAAANRSGRAASEILLVAVSKTHPPDTIRTAWNAGQRVFGENRVQDALPKMPDLPAEMEWHFIGHLQKNKVKLAVKIFDMIETVGSLELAELFDLVEEALDITELFDCAETI